ncbi:MAG: CoA transferase [Candidatus Binatia bacterium]|nr:CoA transferase [Candidatus Binatia bacterium]
MPPLSGLRVLDLSTEIAGPYCSKLFRDAGASVLKVESPAGDPMRRWSASGAEIPEDEDGALFQFLNSGKQSVVLDLERAGDRARLLELASNADLVIESFGAGGLARRGLDFDSFSRAQPRLSLVSISPWGLEGPWAERPATEWTLQAAVGMTARRGLPERGPVGAAGRIGEWVAGTYASFGALVAWLSTRNTGRGQHVDVSMFEALLQCGTQYHDLNGQFTGKPLDQFIDTPSVEPAKDGWVGFATVTAQQWQDFCAMVERPELADETKYHHTDNRMKELPFIQNVIHSWTREHTVDEIIELASALRIPVAPIGNGETLPNLDHFAERGVFQTHPGGFLQPRVPYRLGSVPRPEPAPAPRLGEHTDGLGAATSATPTTDTGDSLPLAGLRVLDLTAFWAGPFLTGHLAMIGADVLKIESTQRPDGMRFVNAIKGQRFWETSSIFHGANANKRDITLNLDSDEGRELFLQLIDDTDILVENFSVRVLSNLGLDPDDLRKRNPKLIVVRMPSWGLDGPWLDRVGFAMNVEQACGLAWLSGYENLPMIVNVCDPIGALHAFFAINLALERRRETGLGDLVEVPLVEPGLNLAAEQLIEHSAYGVLLERTGNRGPYAAPQGVYLCGDEKHLALAVVDDEQWKALCQVLENPSWTEADDLRTAAGRRAAHDRIDEELRKVFAEMPCGEISSKLLAAGVPAEPLNNAHTVMPNPQLEHRQFFQELEHEVVGTRRYPTLPMGFSTLGPKWHRSPPPTMGQHNQEVLGGTLGVTDERLADLAERKIIGDRPAWR